MLLLASVSVVGACGRDDGNVLDPEGAQAERIAGLGWFLVVTATVVSVVFLGLLVHGLVRGGRSDASRPRVSETGFVVAGGVALPLVVIAVITVLALDVLADDADDGALSIQVTGYQYWWEVTYPDAGFTTANEFAIPVGRPVEVTLRSADVIHSFWLPDLAGKIDMVPGQENSMVLSAEEPGRYRGQCAEYCGIQHAQMAFFVDALPEDDFEDWVDARAADAREPVTASERTGLEAFNDLPCASCHTIRGTEADGDQGPDLTHLASRETIGADAVPNDRGHLGGWIANSQTAKPGNTMPPIPMAPDQLQTLLDYLESLE